MKYLMTILMCMAMLTFVACSDDSKTVVPVEDAVSDSSEASDAAEDAAPSDVADDADAAPEADAAADSAEE